MRLSGTYARSISSSRGLGNQLWDLAGNRPSLDLRFAESKSLVDATTGANLIDFTRASSGTYVGSDGLIKTATTNEARFGHDPTTGESLGLLVEESRTNLLLYSEELDNASWTKNASTVSANSLQSPDGLINADKLIENSANTTHFIRQNATAIIGNSYTSSVYAKASERTSMVLVHFDGSIFSGVQVNLSTGSKSSPPADLALVDASSTAEVIPFLNGWYRISLTRTQVNSTTIQTRVTLTTGSNGAYLGDGASGIYLWGAQLEEGAFPTSYIPTEGSEGDRAADVVSITGTNFSSWYRQDEGTLFAEAEGSGPLIIPRATASAGNRIQFAIGSSALVVGGNVEANFNNTTALKRALAFKLNNTNAAFDGILGTNDENCTIPSVDYATIGYFDFGGLLVNNGPIKRLTFWPTRLPDPNLQGITQ